MSRRGPGAIASARPRSPTKDERTAKGRRSISRLTKWLVSVGVLVTALAFGVQWTLHQSYFRVQHVTFVGLRHEGVVEVLRASGFEKHPSMLSVTDVSLTRSLSRFPWINSVQVTKHWPHSVVVTVHESVAVAVAFTSTHHLVFVDAEGRALGPAPLHEDLPTLVYLHPTSTTWPYQGAGRGAAYVASQLPRAFTTQVSTITDNAKGNGDTADDDARHLRFGSPERPARQVRCHRIGDRAQHLGARGRRGRDGARRVSRHSTIVMRKA